MAVKMESEKIVREKLSSLDAMALPLMIPATESGKVLKRAAANQTESLEFKRLRKLWVLFKIRISFVQKSLFPLLCLIHKIIHQGRISSQLHQSVLTIKFSI